MCFYQSWFQFAYGTQKRFVLHLQTSASSLPTRHTHTPNNVSSCEESHGEHLVVHSHLDYLLAFSSSLENTDSALTICLACLVLAQWDLENHVGMWIQSIKICECNVIPKVSSSQMVPVSTVVPECFSKRQFLFKFLLFAQHLFVPEKDKEPAAPETFIFCFLWKVAWHFCCNFFILLYCFFISLNHLLIRHK